MLTAEAQTLIYLSGVLAVPSFTWWLVKRMLSDLTINIKEIQKAQIELRTLLPIEYVMTSRCNDERKNRDRRYSEDLREVKERLDKIFDKLELKVDKTDGR